MSHDIHVADYNWDIAVNEELTYDYGVRNEGWMKVKSVGDEEGEQW